MIMDEKTKNWCLHVDTRQWLENIGRNDPWLIIYNAGEIYNHKEEDRFIWSFLINNESVEKELAEYTFNQFDGYPVTDTYEKDGSITYYSRFGYDDREPLFFRRRFTGKEGYLELSQEFIHFFELYYDQPNSRYLLISSDGGEETVVQIRDNREISILARRLKQYLAFKNMSLMLCVSIRRFFNEPIGEGYFPTNSKQVLVRKETNLHYSIWYQDYSGKTRFFSELIGKKLIPAMSIEKTGIHPFKGPARFEDFIIGQDENGLPVEYSCNPDGLSDYFGNNPGRPHYLTPVFFNKDVLTKYYSNPEKYRVEDGDIRIGDHILRADTNHPEYVVIYLGDLGRDIPYSEQRYWKSFNLIPSGQISVTAFRRNFLGEFADPEAEQFVFRNKYEDLQNIWQEKFGWTLFKTVNRGDRYRLDNIRVPITENQQEFDQQVEALVVVMIDSINQDEIGQSINKREECKRSIQSLELFCKFKNMIGFEENIAFLRSLYRLRSLGTSHRKDTKEYPKIRTEFKIDERGYINAFREILTRAISLLDFFISYASQL